MTKSFLISTQRLLEAKTFAKLSHYLLLAYCLVASLSIALTEILVIPLSLYALIFCFCGESKRQKLLFPDELKAVLRPFFFWLLCALLAVFVGIDPATALPAFLKMLLNFVLPFAVMLSFSQSGLRPAAIIKRIKHYFIALLAGQSLATLHTILSSIFPAFIIWNPPGPVTEAGQVLLVICAPLAFFLLSPALITATKKSPWKTTSSLLLFLFLSLSFIAMTWPENILLQLLPFTVLERQFIVFLFCLVLFGFYFLAAFYLTRSPRLHWRFAVFLLLSALLFCDLVITLKRGPWLGVFAALCILGFLLSRRLLLIVAATTLTIFLLFSPAKERFFAIEEHFNIAGGRKTMWLMGIDLAQRFPLGLGLKNASFMRSIDPTLPDRHRHMHNNLLNIAVETGWLGLLTFVWCIVSLLRLGFVAWLKNRSSPALSARVRALLFLLLANAILAWQVAGLVEYNFGDGEVRTMALFFIGLLLALVQGQASAKAASLRGRTS